MRIRIVPLYWDDVPNRCCIRLIVIAIATAICLVGNLLSSPDWQGADGGRGNSVALSSPATHAPAAVRATRIKDGGGNFVPGPLPLAGRAWFHLPERSPGAFSAEPPNAFRNARRALPLAPRAPLLA